MAEDEIAKTTKLEAKNGRKDEPKLNISAKTKFEAEIGEGDPVSRVLSRVLSRFCQVGGFASERQGEQTGQLSELRV